MKTKSLVTILVLGIVFLSSCKKVGIPRAEGTQTGFTASKSGVHQLELSFTGLESLGSNFKYEGWIMVNGSPVSTGKFIITPSGQMAPSTFPVDGDDLEDATAFILTIEPQPDTDPGPSATKMLAGNFSGSSASLVVSHTAALGNTFLSASGKLIMATPTTASTADEKSGVWFIDNSSGSGMPGLSVPTLPAGWRYEGWAVVDGQPLTTGTFTSVSAADMAAPFSGPLSGPPFPGEDYITNAPEGLTFPTDLAGKKIVLTIEPYPDNSSDPFTLKPLAVDISPSSMAHTVISMTNNASTFPTGTASR